MELDKIFQVSEFNEFISTYLESVGQVVIEGELSQLKLSQNRWIFGTIKDDKASVDIFSTVFQITNINQLEEGMLVKIYGVPRLYQKTGRFSVSVSQIVPSGQGALQRAFEKLKAQLEKEGLFDLARKRPLPRFPEKIGLITAKGSQAYNDFIKVLAERMGGIKLIFVPVLVQGADSPKSIVNAIKYLNKEHPELDLMVITRGGGSLEDLIGFNDEGVARAIFASNIPVVSAVGHEGDWSLSDLVADLRASTPSNAAELVVPHRETVALEINHMLEGIVWTLKEHINDYSLQMSELIKRSTDSVKANLDIVSDCIDQFKQQLEKYVLQVESVKTEILGLERLLLALDAKSVLKRGFTMTYANGELLRDTSSISTGEVIKTVLFKGSIDSTINKIQLDDE